METPDRSTIKRPGSLEDAKVFDSHVHTPFCGHAVGRPAAYVWQACRRNLRGLTFTCHNPMPDGFTPTVRMQEGALPYYVELVRELRETFSGILEVKLGLECDWLPGYESFLEEQAQAAPFEFIMGSVHAHFPEYHERFVSDDVVASQRRYFELLAESAETGLFDCLAHPDQIKNVFPDEWDPGTIEDSIFGALDRIAASGVSMELNTSGIYKAVPEMNPGALILSEMQKRGISVVLGSDAHQPDRIADEFEYSLEMLGELGFKTVSYYTNRTRKDVDIQEARESLITA